MMPSDVREQLVDALSGRYAVDRLIGTGGMATVYLARDLRHDRLVALKVLSPELGAVLGSERFLAEIKVTANLQHPNLLPLFDSGDANGLLFYVMPYVMGESLRARLERDRQLPVDEAVRLAVAIANALDYAHRHGVIHRDLKPENILLHEGQPLVADFGIALAVSAAGGARMTHTGLSLGTPEYMAPEQATGERTIDARADVYALGAVLYEMLAGEPPFTGPSAQAIVAKVITERAPPVTRSRELVPVHVAAAVARALEKVPADRIQSAADFSIALTQPSAMHVAQRETRATYDARSWIRDPRKWAVLPLAAMGIFALALVRGKSQPTTQVLTVSSSLVFASGQAASVGRGYAVSPDGSRLAYATPAAIDGGRLWIRSLIDGESHPVLGTEGAEFPFWSPDGSSIGYFGNNELFTAPSTGGPPTRVAEAESEYGGAWNADGVILFARRGVFYRISADGGKTSLALPLAPVDQGARRPVFFPDQKHFLYWAYKKGTGAVWIGDLATGTAARFPDSEMTDAIYAPGFLLFSRPSGSSGATPLVLQRFDVSRRALTGKSVVISYLFDRPENRGSISASNDVLVYSNVDTAALRSQAWGFWNIGDKQLTPFTPGNLLWIARVSHDARRIAFGGFGLWVRDVGREVSVKIPSKLYIALNPVWSPGDSILAYNGGEGRDRSFQMVSMSGAEERTISVPSANGHMQLLDWSPDGRTILFLQTNNDGDPSIGLWGYGTGDRQLSRVLHNAGSVFDARFSPDGHWIAYESNESGTHEVYLSHYPASGTPIRISTSGGAAPRWRGDGREMYFIAGRGTIMRTSLQLGSIPRISTPQLMLPEPVTLEPFRGEPPGFDVMPSGNRFVILRSSLMPPVLQIVTGWRGLLKGDSAQQ